MLKINGMKRKLNDLLSRPLSDNQPKGKTANIVFAHYGKSDFIDKI